MILTPLEVDFEEDNFLFIDVGKLSRLLLHLFGIVVKINIIWIEVLVWVDDGNDPWVILNTLAIVFKPAIGKVPTSMRFSLCTLYSFMAS